ncbi:hypothetical protein NFI96_015868 [Prochilodus magdalenae]|nr:hypothetical protein NFI96_015868 [Prochilodus magdalenae]
MMRLVRSLGFFSGGRTLKTP